MSRAQSLANAPARARKSPQLKRSSGAPPILTGNRLNLALCLLLFAVVIALYSPVLGHQFVIVDDDVYVSSNPHIQDGLSWDTIKWAFTAGYAANWHPLTWLSHALDYQLFGLNPMGHHLSSVLLHALNSALLFLLLVRVTGRLGPSLLVAGLFALHPLNVESVAWVAERKNVLSTLLFILTIAAYAWYAQRPFWRRYLLVVVLFAAGLMSKPMVITLPFVLLLLDYWPLERVAPAGRETTENNPDPSKRLPRLANSTLLLEKVPLLLFSAASAWITLKAQAQGEAVHALNEFPISVRIENALVSYGLYLWKMLWPARLAALYPHSVNMLPLWEVAISTAALIMTTVLVLVFRQKRYLPVGWFWFLGTLVPVIGLVQVGVAAMADRYAYIPLIGIFIMIAWGLDDWANAKKLRMSKRLIPALSILLALAIVTIRQMRYWENEYTLWEHALAVTENNPFAHSALAAALMNTKVAALVSELPEFDTEQKRLEVARENYADAVMSYRQRGRSSKNTFLPEMASTINNLAFVTQLQNHPDEARQHYQEALVVYRQLSLEGIGQSSPNMAVALSNLASLDRQQGLMDEAHDHYAEASRIYRELTQKDPRKHMQELAWALNNLGNVEKDQQRMDEARQHYEEALKIYRELAPDVRVEDTEQSAIWWETFGIEASSIPRLADIAGLLNNLGRVDGLQNRLPDAHQHFADALKIYRQLAEQDPNRYLPDLAWTLYSLGFADQLQKRFDESRGYSTEALTIYRKLAQQEPGKYANDLARVETSLRQLEKKVSVQ